MSNLRNLIVFGGEGGGTPPEPPTLIEKSITANGVYSASDDNADGYSKVTANVPNTYTQSDEGKVVSNGALVAQTAYPTTITANSIYDTTLYDSVTVDVQPPPPLQPVSSGATIYDFDGTVIATYTPEEFAALTEYPAHPTHEYLTADGYNWTLANAKAYSAKYGYVEVGAQYHVADGKTRLFIRLEEGRIEPQLGLGINGSVDVDWGDGSAHDTMTGSDINTTVYQTHTYAQAGNYIITLTVTGTMQFNGTNGYGYILGKSGGNRETNRVYLNALQSLYIGDSVTTIGDHAFESCYSLTTVIIPDSVTSIGNSAFFYCTCLSSVTVPDSVTSISDYAFQYCFAMVSAIIPDSVTSIGDSAFRSDYNLSSVTIPDSVTSIDSYAFYSCNRLTTVSILDSITTIGSSAFTNCNGFASVTIPDSVTSIDSSAFSNCYGLGFIKFASKTPPTVSASSTFNNIPTDCIIYAPALVLNLYMNGTNYPSKTTYKYIGYATYESGVTLPDKTTDETHTLTWYATVSDAISGTNPITVGNGNEIYARATAI